MILTQERLKEFLAYEPESGIFRWRVSRGTAKAGSIAGVRRKDGYIVIRIFGVLHYAHRLAWLYMTGEWPSDLLDHRFGNASDNRWEKLREADKVENGLNAKTRSDNTTGFKGVSRHKKRFRAQIVVNGLWHDLGLHKTAEQAHRAYVEAAERLAGEFARAA